MGRRDVDDRDAVTDRKTRLERDRLLILAGMALVSKLPEEGATYGAIFSGGGVHVGPPHGRLKRMKLKFSISGQASFDRCAVFHALQKVLRGGEVPYRVGGDEDWTATAATTCRHRCKRR